LSGIKHFPLWTVANFIAKRHFNRHFAPVFFKENFYHMTSGPEPEKTDWHPADVLAALKKRGKTLSGVSRAHGYHATAAGKALKRPWPALEALIAAELSLTPEDIWPARYPRPAPLPR
jgi:Ner family transcriptional regulator